MERVFPTRASAWFVRSGAVASFTAVSELGVYGVYLGDGGASGPILNGAAGERRIVVVFAIVGALLMRRLDRRSQWPPFFLTFARTHSSLSEPTHHPPACLLTQSFAVLTEQAISCAPRLRARMRGAWRRGLRCWTPRFWCDPHPSITISLSVLWHECTCIEISRW